jgi:hypothetical protein
MTVIPREEDPFSTANMNRRLDGLNHMEASDARKHKIYHEFHMEQKKLLLTFSDDRVKRIVRQREKQIDRMNYVIDVLDILLHHLNNLEHFRGRRRHQMTLLLGNDFRLCMSVARQEIYFQR